MTQPRLVCPGATVMITRRTLRRTCLLRPDTQLRELYRYCLAVAAAQYDIEVHAAVLMSTHEHLVVTDPHGKRSLFLRELHRLVALGVKVLRSWEGAVWDHEPTSIVELLTPEAVIEKLAYVMANPVTAGLVRRAADWPGVRTLPCELGRVEWSATRPTRYFRADDRTWPPIATLKLTLPRCLDMSDDEAREAVAEALQQAEEAARAEVKAKGWAFLGSRRAATASPYGRARSWEPLRGRNPTFAVGRKQPQAFFAAVERLRRFRSRYREARARWLSGVRDVVFPHGTWAMQWQHHVAVAIPG